MKLAGKMGSRDGDIGVESGRADTGTGLLVNQLLGSGRKSKAAGLPERLRLSNPISHADAGET